MEILKVSAESDASATAGALANTVREAGEAELQGIGPKAVNQAVKSIAIARSYMASSGVDLVAMPSFVDVEIDGEQRTALRFSIAPRHRIRMQTPSAREEAVEAAASEPRSTDAAPAEREPVGSEETPDPTETPAPADTEDESEHEAPVLGRRSSLSEAITGRPASELGETEPDDAEEDEEDEEPPRRRFLGDARNPEFDRNRDVF